LTLFRVNFHNLSDIVARFGMYRLQYDANPKKLLNSDAVFGGVASFKAFILCSVNAIPLSENFKP
jgi:hypothetical protein